MNGLALPRAPAKKVPKPAYTSKDLLLTRRSAAIGTIAAIAVTRLGSFRKQILFCRLIEEQFTNVWILSKR